MKRNISSEVNGLATIVVVKRQSDTKLYLEIRGGVKATPSSMGHQEKLHSEIQQCTEALLCPIEK